VLHQQVVASSEHQIRLSKGVTAKFVLLLDLRTINRLAQMKKPPQWWLLCFGIFGPPAGGFDLYFKGSKLDGVIWQISLGFCSGFPEWNLRLPAERAEGGAATP
jgi:hypothetical protein